MKRVKLSCETIMDNSRDILSLVSSDGDVDLNDSNIGCYGLKHLSSNLRYTQIDKLKLKSNNIMDDGVKYLAESLIYTQITHLDLSYNNIGCDGLKYLSLALKDAKVTSLNLCQNKIGCNGLKHLSLALKSSKVTRLDLRKNKIGSDGLKYLSLALKDAKVTSLNLSHNNIGCSGLKYLTQALKNSKIDSLDLINTNIMCESIEYLAESLRDAEMEYLNLSENKIGFDAAQYLFKMLRNTKVKFFFIDIHCTKYSDVDHYISHRCYYDIRKVHIILHSNKIGRKGAEYLNKLFEDTAIARVSLRKNLEADDARYLTEAFKWIKICELDLIYGNFMREDHIQNLIEAFKFSRVGKLNLHGAGIRTEGARQLAKFLRQVEVLDLDLSFNRIGDEGLEYLVPVLKDTGIMYIHLAGNELEIQGVKHLSEILENSKIIHIDLCDNRIGPDGAKHLADVLPNSQVSEIHLHGNRIEYTGYQYLLEVMENTNLSWININEDNRRKLYGNNSEAGSDERTKRWPDRIPRSTTSIPWEICNVFKKLVSLNPRYNRYEFIVPEDDKYIGRYAFLIRILKDTPNSKAHIFDMMCKSSDVNYYDFDKMDLIDEFVAEVQNKFYMFIEHKLLDSIESFGISNYVNLVKQFEDLKQCDIVENLLLHRVLYYVDENQEILHPYIYKMMDKYGMPLYSEQLEPNKKEEIIAFYRGNQEIEGAQDIIDFLNHQ